MKKTQEPKDYIGFFQRLFASMEVERNTYYSNIWSSPSVFCLFSLS